MKARYLLLLVSVFALFSTFSNAQCNFFLPDLTNFQVNGNANANSGCYNLTASSPGQAGSAYYRDSANLNYDFDVSFNTNQCGDADGMAFVLQSCSNGLNALSGTGSNLGY